MSPSALPFTRQHPLLVEEKPSDGPGHNAIGKKLVGAPTIFYRIVDTEFWKVRMAPVAVNVLRRLTGPSRIRSDRGIHHEHANIRVFDPEAAEVPPGEVDYSDSIGLADRRERSLPNPNPTGVRDEPELWIFFPQVPILFVDEKWDHLSPHGLAFGVAKAPVGTAADPRAGIEPVRAI